MEEALRKELHQIWLRKHEGEISEEEGRHQTKELIHKILEENPQRLLDLCEGHISGLQDVSLLEMAKNKPNDFAYMNISSGAYRFSDIVKGSGNPNSRKIKKIYRKSLSILGIDEDTAKKILNKTSSYDGYNDDPAETILELLEDEGLCASIDWKFGLEDVEYNLNCITKRLGLEPIREYPPYEEGQPLGMEALEVIINESIYSAVVILDGDTLYVFLTSKDKASALKEELDQLEDLWCFDSPFII